MTAADAACTRARLQQRLAVQYGPLVGYKAGLTNPAVQKRFHTDQPVWGALYRDMLLNGGAVVSPAFGARPLFEADMLVRVKDAGVNNASTPAEVLAHVDQIIPFMEATIRVFDRYGEREKRMKARMKFLLQKLGLENFLDLIEIVKTKVHEVHGVDLLQEVIVVGEDENTPQKVSEGHMLQRNDAEERNDDVD